MARHLAIALESARVFFRWWAAELAFLVPSLLRKRLGADDVLAVALAGDRAVLSHEVAGKACVLGEIPAEATKAASAGILKLLGRVSGLRERFAAGRLPVTLRLPSDQALRTQLSLPLAAEANLRQVVAFQLDRRTPFQADTVHFAHRIVRRDEAAKQLEVELAVVPRSVVAAAIALGRAIGLRPSAVEVAAQAHGGAPSGNLLPEDERQHRRPVTLMRRVAVATVALAAVAGLYQPVHGARRAADDLQQRAQAAKELALQGRKLKDEVAKLTEAEQFLVGGKRETPSATEIIYELTRVLPDDTWVDDLHIAAGEIRISGFSKSASTVIKLLEQSGIFAGPQFRSAVTQDQASGKEKFEITAKIAKRSMS
jgi:general secretion pathway protein L